VRACVFVCVCVDMVVCNSSTVWGREEHTIPHNSPPLPGHRRAAGRDRGIYLRYPVLRSIGSIGQQLCCSWCSEASQAGQQVGRSTARQSA
jgi:hypothetical protein